MDALELQARLRADGAGIPVLLLIARGDVRTAVRAIQGGAFDVLEKPVAAEALRDSVRSAIAAESTRLPALAERRAAARRLGTLTDREREVMGLLIDGLSAPAIANRLGVHPKTAEAHRSNILRKLELKSMPELIRFSLRHRPRPILYRREPGQRGDAAG
jgi:FixJ family two-component response regulator